MLPDPPLPVLAQRLGAPARVEITFDQQLQPGPLAPNNWNWRWTNFQKTGQAPATAVGNLVTVREFNEFLDVGPDEITYTAVIPDVANLFGIPAAAFAGFPLV